MNVFRIFLLILLTSLVPFSQAGVLPVTWSNEYHSTGPNAPVYSLIHWQGEVVAAGLFDAIGTVAVPSHVARLRDGTWQPLGNVAIGSRVLTILVHDSALHALVTVESGNQVKRFDGVQWSDVGDPAPSSSTAMASFQGDLYLASFRLEGEAWINRLQTDDSVNSLVVHDGLLVAGGEFSTGAGINTGPVLAWDGESVTNAYPGQVFEVNDLTFWNGQLFVARSPWGPDPAYAVQTWQDGVWVDIPELGWGNAARHTVDLEPGDGCLLACGYWEDFLIEPNRSGFGAFATSWDGTSAETLSYVQGNLIYWEVLPDGENILVGGQFATAGQPNCANLGRAIDGAVTPVCEPGLGLSGRVNTLQSNGNAMVAGGGFASVAGLNSRAVAVYESGTWFARDLANGASYPHGYNYLTAVGWYFDVPYVVAGAHSGEGAGYWTGDQWEMTEEIWDYPNCDKIQRYGNMLLGVETWGGVLRFSNLSSPTYFAEVDGGIRDLVVRGDDLVVAGEFVSIEGTLAANVAIYADGYWQSLAGGLPDPVRVLGTWQDQIVAVTYRDNESVINLQVGNQWQTIGVLPGGVVFSVMEYDGHLFFGGFINSPADDGIPMQGIACWNGLQWRSVGPMGRVYSLAVHDEKLWVGGDFNFAGGVPAWNLTNLTIDEPTAVDPTDLPLAKPLLTSTAPNPFNPQTTVSFDLPVANQVLLDVYDPRGQHVVQLINGHRHAGHHTVDWNGKDHQGRTLPSGTYLLRLKSGNQMSTSKVTLAR